MIPYALVHRYETHIFLTKLYSQLWHCIRNSEFQFTDKLRIFFITLKLINKLARYFKLIYLFCDKLIRTPWIIHKFQLFSQLCHVYYQSPTIEFILQLIYSWMVKLNRFFYRFIYFEKSILQQYLYHGYKPTL